MISLGAFANTQTQLGSRKDIENPYFEKTSVIAKITNKDGFIDNDDDAAKLDRLRERFLFQKYLDENDLEDEEDDMDEALLRYTRARRMNRTNGMVANAKILSDSKDQRVLNQSGVHSETDEQWEEKLDDAQLVAVNLSHQHVQGSALTDMQVEKLLQAYDVTALSQSDASALFAEIVSLGALTDAEAAEILGKIEESTPFDLSRYIADETARYTAGYNEMIGKGSKLSAADLRKLEAVGAHLQVLAGLQKLSA